MYVARNVKTAKRRKEARGAMRAKRGEREIKEV
jgi:hypothetical protein